MKSCSKCGEQFPATSEYFHRDKSKTDGFATVCKKCRQSSKTSPKKCRNCKRTLIRRNFPDEDWTNPDRICFQCQGLKWCAKCDQWFPATLEYFHPASHNTDGLRSWCKPCTRKYANSSEYTKRYRRNYYMRHKDKANKDSRLYYREHIEECREYHKSYRQQNKEKRRFWNKQRRRAQHGKYTSADIKLLYKSQKGLCWWCGEPLNDVYHIDHRVPISKGGSDNPENLCLTCPHCNLSKNNKLPGEFNGRLL